VIQVEIAPSDPIKSDGIRQLNLSTWGLVISLKLKICYDNQISSVIFGQIQPSPCRFLVNPWLIPAQLQAASKVDVDWS
jgi:hypothetical protein